MASDWPRTFFTARLFLFSIIYIHLALLLFSKIVELIFYHDKIITVCIHSLNILQALPKCHCLCTKFALHKKKSLPIMLALYSMLLPSYYAQNYTGIIGSGLCLYLQGNTISGTLSSLSAEAFASKIVILPLAVHFPLCTV